MLVNYVSLRPDYRGNLCPGTRKCQPSARRDNVNFGSAVRAYFFTPDGKRIITDKNIRKCQRYVIRQLNNAKNLKSKNQELVDTFRFDKRQGTENYDYSRVPKVRSVYEYAIERAKGFVNIICGKDTERVDALGKEIGKAKHISLVRTGSKKSFETSYTARQYHRRAPEIADEIGIYKDGKRQAFGVVFDPKYKKNGELKGFEYNRCGYFDEESLTADSGMPLT